MDLKDLKIEQIQDYIQQEKAKRTLCKRHC